MSHEKNMYEERGYCISDSPNITQEDVISYIIAAQVMRRIVQKAGEDKGAYWSGSAIYKLNDMLHEVGKKVPELLVTELFNTFISGVPKGYEEEPECDTVCEEDGCEDSDGVSVSG